MGLLLYYEEMTIRGVVIGYTLALLAACGNVSTEGAVDADVCPSPSMVCGSTCTNVQNDNNNCGTCGNACPAGTRCDGTGQCSASCVTGSEACGGVCTDL